MPSADKKSKGDPPRRNTFQKMLDLEKKNKLHRMSTSTSTIPGVRSSTTSRDSSPNPKAFPSLQTTGRAMSTPVLSLSIPTGQPANNSTKPRFVIKDGDVVPEEEGADDDASETSSICHSPGWDDLSGRKKKKEKEEKERRKKEREKAEAKAVAKARTEAKHAEKIKNRMTKAPPTNDRLSKLGIMMDRNSSAPAVQQTPKIPRDEGKIRSGGRSRRGSVEIGLKSFIQATQAIPVPWRSSHGTPYETTPTETTPVREEPSPKSSASEGNRFIGGLKLKLAEEATVQDAIRKQSLSEDSKAQEKAWQQSHPRDNTSRTPPKSRRASGAKSQRRVSFGDPSPTNLSTSDARLPSEDHGARTPQNWDSIYAQAAVLVMTPQETHDEDIGPRERNGKQKSYPPTSSYFPLDVQASSPRRDSSSGSHARTSSQPRPSEADHSRGNSRGPSLARDASNERRDSAESSRGRGMRGYVSRQRQESRDRSFSRYEDELRASQSSLGSNMPPASKGRRMSWHSAKSGFRVGANPKDPSSDNRFSTSPDTYSSTTLPSSETSPTSPVTGSLLQRRLSSRSANIPTLKGFKSAAKAAFARNSSDIGSSAARVPGPPPLSAVRSGQPILVKRSSMLGDDGTESPRLSKAERFFGQSISTAVVDDSLEVRPPSSGRSSTSSVPASSRHLQGPNTVEKALENSASFAKNAQAGHSRSATDSSEEYSPYDESSNITTPTASRPHSHKDYVTDAPGSKSSERIGSKTSPSGAAFMSGGLPHAASVDDRSKGEREKSAYTKMSPAQVSSLTESTKPGQLSSTKLNGEARPYSESGLRKLSVPEASGSPNLSRTQNDDSDLYRQPSLTRSISTPDLQQDLSFLPALKHQPLIRPTKEKDKHKQNKGKGNADSAPPQEEVNQTTVTKSASFGPSAPASPLSSAYLESARLNLPKQSLRNSQAGDPLAKMFVVCCACKYFHDMPSKIYECMARAESVVEDRDLGVRGVVSTAVKCPWCGHGMSTSCCAGYAAVVYLREKLH